MPDDYHAPERPQDPVLRNMQTAAGELIAIISRRMLDADRTEAARILGLLQEAACDRLPDGFRAELTAEVMALTGQKNTAVTRAALAETLRRIIGKALKDQPPPGWDSLEQLDSAVEQAMAKKGADNGEDGEESCKTCRWWKPPTLYYTDEPLNSDCHRRPPEVVSLGTPQRDSAGNPRGPSIATTYPTTAHDDVCGDYERSAEKEADDAFEGPPVEVVITKTDEVITDAPLMVLESEDEPKSVGVPWQHRCCEVGGELWTEHQEECSNDCGVSRDTAPPLRCECSEEDRAWDGPGRRCFVCRLPYRPPQGRA